MCFLISVAGTRQPLGKNINLDPYVTPHTKVNSAPIKELRVKNLDRKKFNK